MVFFIIGLGLGSPQDVTMRGLKAIQSCHQVYLQYYTSIMGVGTKQLSQFFGKPIIQADRDFCQVQIDQLLLKISKDSEHNYGFLVVGDPFCATTHSDLYLRAVNLGIKVQVIHNASIVSAVGCTGLQVYEFGEIVSVPYFTEKWRPDSFYDKIAKNRANGLHTLVLLDIKVKQRSEQNILKDKKIFQPPRFMSCKECVEQLLEVEEKRGGKAFSQTTKCFGLARVGFKDQKIVAAEMKSFLEIEMGPPLHSFVICNENLHSVEKEMYEFYSK